MAGIAEACIAVLEKLNALPDVSTSPNRPRSLVASIEETRSRFQVWSDNIGACQPLALPTSLGHRIRGVSKLQELFMSCLEDLQEDLNDLEYILDDIEPDLLERVPFISTTSTTSEISLEDLPDAVADISQLLKAINEDIISLFKLSIATRQSATRDRYAAAMLKVDTNEVADENAEAELIGNQFGRLRSPDLLWLKLRLAQANVSRRKFLLYCERHQAQAMIEYSRSAEVPALPMTTDSNTEDDSASVIAKSTASTAHATEFERIQHTVDTDEDDAESFVSYVSEIEPTSRSRLTVCDLEQVRNGQEIFICAYCKTEQALRSQNAWRRHVLGDIRAYICTFRSCKLCLFQDSYAWLSHELSQHFLFRQCLYCDYQCSVEAPEELKTHMTTSHPSNIMAQQLPKLIAATIHQADRIPSSACHFCDWRTKIRSREKFTGSHEEIYVSPQRYRRHVGAHLEQAALNVISATSEDDSESESDYSGGDHPGEAVNRLDDIDVQGTSLAEDFYILVMGVTGSGKSSFVQLCTDEHIRVGHSLQSETARVSMHRCNLELGRNASSVWLIDTPGFDDTHRSDTEVLKGIATFLGELYKSGRRLSGIIYMHRITDTRVGGSTMRNLSMMKQLLGPAAMASLAFVTTKWQEVSADVGLRRQQELITVILKDEIERGARIERHDNGVDSASKLLMSFLALCRPVILKIQEEMVDRGLPLSKTSAGQELEGHLEKMREKYERELLELKSDMQEAIKTKDEEFKTMILEERAEMERKMKELEEQKLKDSDDVE